MLLRGFCFHSMRVAALIAILPLTIVFAQPTQAIAADSFSLHTGSFSKDIILQPRYTCEGEDISPSLYWENAPSQTKSFALMMTDIDASGGTFYHWVVYNIPPTITEILAGAAFSAPTLLGENSWDKAQYNGPCPPKGETHRYVFDIYALNAQLTLPAAQADGNTVMHALRKHVLAKAQLSIRYRRLQ